MTAHSHDPATHVDSPRPRPAAGPGTAPPVTRPWWLLPGLAAGIVVGALVVVGALPLTTVVYAGLLGGMLLMHVGGHGGHGGHGGQAGHDAHGDGTRPEARDLRSPSSDTQLRGSGSANELDDRALKNRNGNEKDDHDQRGSHGCH